MTGVALVHPDPQQLAAFAIGKLVDQEWSAVATHLETCAACGRVVENVPRDRLVALLQGESPIQNTPSTSEPGAASVGGLDVPPELVGHPRYRVLGLLGRGGMGAVYQAQHCLMERIVALKVVRKSLLKDGKSVERFRREVRAAARLSHPNIVAAYDAEQAGDLHFLVMEHVEGSNLAQLVKGNGQARVPDACAIIRQVALGLQHAHEHGMVHRDLKPQNLMVTPGGQVKILDFGLARLARELDQASSLTQTGAVMGTPDYLAPEQATDPHLADIRADIYSLGCSFYFLLVGEPPFPGGTLIQKLLAHREKPVPAVGMKRPDLPTGLTEVLGRMLAKDPAERYQEPQEVAQALADYVRLTSRPVAPPASTPTPPAGLRSTPSSDGDQPLPAEGGRPATALIAGQVLAGRYRVEDCSGSGGMGEVWRALDQELGLPVAIKVLPPALARNPRGLRALKQEATLLLKLTHPNICRLYHFHTEGGFGFLAMEFIDGPTLEAVLENKPDHRMPLAEALPIFRHIADALDLAHQQDPPILHRDIKPANIMLTSAGQPKLMDFGIAREIRDSMTRTTGQDMVGTLLYMAPEQFQGKKLGPAADLYSLAASLYECLAGHPPFHTGAVSHQLVHLLPEGLRAQGVNVSERVDMTILKALAKLADDRFSSAGDFIRALEGGAVHSRVVSGATKHDCEFVVAKSGPSDYQTISEAVRNVPHGGRIKVRPGTYREGIVLSHPVEIVGEGPVADIVIENEDSPCLTCQGGDAVIRGLTIVGKMDDNDESTNAAAVLMTDGRARIEDCRVSSTGAGIAICGVMANPTIIGCKIYDCGAEGVVVCDDAQGAIEKCDISGNKGAGLAVAQGGNPVVRNCKIRDGKAAGVLVTDQGQGTIEDCDIYCNTLMNISVKRYSNPSFRRCKIHDSRTHPGVSISDGGQGTFEDCEVFCNRAAGVAIRQGGRPTLRRCRIHAQADQGGVLVVEKGQGIVEDCDIFGNRLAGVTIKEEGNPTIRRCKIHDSRTRPGIFVYAGGRGTIEDCEIFGNKLAGVEIKEGGNPTVRHCRIKRNGFYGVHVHGKGQGTVTDCEFSSNTFGACNVQAYSSNKQS